MKKAEALKILTSATWKAIVVNDGENIWLQATYNGHLVELRDDEAILRVDGEVAYDVEGLEEFESLFPLFWMAQ